MVLRGTRTGSARVPFAEDGERMGRGGVRIDVQHLTQIARTSGRRGSDVRILDDVSLAVEAGQLVGIVGGSGAGKTTLVQALAGVRPAASGSVRFDGVDLRAHLPAFRTMLGYVPQDDIIHADLPLRRTLRYAARLRLPTETTAAAIDRAITHALAALELTDRADVPVSALSGGQRKRASIAVELLSDPQVFFLDEPTSGLDPATSTELLGVLRRLADEGSTIVFTTHAVQDLAACDRIVFLAPGGRLAFTGSLTDALQFFDVATPAEIYTRLAAGNDWAEHRPGRTVDEPTPEGVGVVVDRRAQANAARQFTVLTQRSFETLLRNRLTMAILVGSPLMVVAMFAILFRSGAFEPRSPDPTSIVMIIFWIAFGSFFFGLTYGLLQICGEMPIVRREHLVGLRLAPYLASKLAVLVPFLLGVDVVMLAVLRALDRLPAASSATYATVGGTLALEATAALALGLLTSAAVSSPSQATLALPMLCFPAVLFSGAILPVHVMARVGVWISTVVPVRWAFEATGHDFGVRHLLANGHSPLGAPLIASYGNAGSRGAGTYALYLLAFTVVFLIAAWMTLRHTSRR